MPRKTILFLAATLWLACSAAWAGEVIQGVMAAEDTKAQTVTVKDELDNKEKVFDVSTAKIGAKPEKGNVLRIAFEKKGDKNIAIKVMNVTKQNLLKEK